jgi:glycosyltransferase involved in cell wall biosynthesis
MYALQVAIAKSANETSASFIRYGRMFEAVGVNAVGLYRGPDAAAVNQACVQVLPASALASPLFALSLERFTLPGRIRKALGGAAPDVAVVHTDAAISPVRRMFPKAVIIAPCEDGRAKAKRRADVVVTLNPEQHGRANDDLKGSAARAVMLGHPFADKFSPVSVDATPRVNFASRLTADKDPMTLALAVSLMHANPKPELRFIGAGPLEGDLKRALSRMGAEAVFTGSPASPLDDFTRGDILVLPSLSEGLPLLLLEAQARGVPVIASNIPGNAFALGDGAYGDLFPKGDAATLALLLDNAVANLDGLRAKAERGRQDLAGRFGARAFWRGLQSGIAHARRGA